jgi:hypothetical protein
MTSAPVLLIQIDGLERPLVAGEPLGQMAGLSRQAALRCE